MRSGYYKAFSILILGFLLGASLTNAYIGLQLDNLSIANQSLQQELLDYHGKLQQLKETSESGNKHIIKSVDTFLILDPLDELTDHDKMSLELECNKKMKEWLNSLLGQEVAGIDSLLIPRIVDNRVIEANGTKYRIYTNLIVVNKKTLVYLKVSVIKNTNLIN